MSITNKGSNKWLVRVRFRIDGKMVEKKATITGDRHAARAAEVTLRKEVKETAADRQGSLRIETFAQALTFFRENSTAKLDRVEPLINRLERDLGTVPLRNLKEKFRAYLEILKYEKAERTGAILSPVTRNRLTMYGKCALSLCLKWDRIDRNPLQGFDLEPEEGRNRVLTVGEQKRLLETLERNKSYLYWPVRFSLKNPIRIGDLRNLRRENLDRFNRYIHFFPSKTKRRKLVECCLECIDDDLLKYFDGLPAECEYLFPRYHNGEYTALGDFKKHWHTMLVEAEIENFHWHDLKHNGITFMLDFGYSILDLKNLGIQFSEKMIERYYNVSAKKVIGKFHSLQHTAPEEQQKNAV